MRLKSIPILVLALVLISSCGKQSEKQAEAPVRKPPDKTTPAKSELTEFELLHGVGPIVEPLALGPLDQVLSEKGRKIFETKCTSCHKLDQRYVGPPLRGVTMRRTPEFVMNMILNPDGMLKKHPEVKKLLAEYLTPMTFQNIEREDARAILEYLRHADSEKLSPHTGAN